MLETPISQRAHAARAVIKNRRSGALALALLGLFAQPAVASPSFAPRPTPAVSTSRPALWVVNDHDTIVYLFGTFHALDDRTHWFRHSIKAAFDASDELVLETIVPDGPAELHAALAQSAATSTPVAGTPVVVTAPQGSFAASAGQAMATGRKVGMSVDKGADAFLKRAAEWAGKPVEGLESFEEQLRMFRSLSMSAGTQTGVTRATPAPGAVADLMLRMQAAWHRGDGNGFAHMLASIEAHSPVTYQRLFARRNANWADWIAARLEKPGVVFVAVGTGHLIGRDSVQNKLSQRGIGSFRAS